MSGENEKSRRKHHKHRGTVAQYCINITIYVFIAMVLAIVALTVAMKPVSVLVHKAEAAMPYKVSDIKTASPDEGLVPADSPYPGSAVAMLSCDKKGLRTTVFYGLNRVSMRNGAGISSKHSVFGDDDKSVVAGYDESFLNALKYVEKGDIITVSTTEKVIEYKVKNTFYESSTEPSGKSKDSALVVYSVFSEFSEHSDECFYVLADKVGEEVVSYE